MNPTKILVLISLLFLESKILCQTWEVVKIEGDTSRNLSFTEMQGEVLFATQAGKQASEIQAFDISTIDQLRYLGKKKINPPLKTRLVGAVGGSIVGYSVGYMMGNIILWWLSYEDLGSLKLFGPRAENINSGQQLIADLALKISMLIGIFGGYDWKTEFIQEEKNYDLVSFSDVERKKYIQSIIWPNRSKEIKEILDRKVRSLKVLINKN